MGGIPESTKAMKVWRQLNREGIRYTVERLMKAGAVQPCDGSS